MAKPIGQRYVNNMKKRGERIILRRMPVVNRDVPNFLKNFVFAKASRRFAGA